MLKYSYIIHDSLLIILLFYSYLKVFCIIVKTLHVKFSKIRAIVKSTTIFWQRHDNVVKKYHDSLFCLKSTLVQNTNQSSKVQFLPKNIFFSKKIVCLFFFFLHFFTKTHYVNTISLFHNIFQYYNFFKNPQQQI